MKRLMAGIFALVLAPFVLADDAAPNDWKRSAIYVTGVADIDAQGKITHLELLPHSSEDNASKALADKLAPLAESTMSHWQFDPVSADGKPAQARTYLHGVFEFRPLNGNVETRLVFTGNGPHLALHPDAGQGPKYPRSMMSALVQAKLTMLALVQPDGSLTDIHLESAQSTDGHAAEEFVRAAIEAMSTWHALPEAVDGHTVKTRIRVPLWFNLDDTRRGGRLDPRLKRSVDSPGEPAPSASNTQMMAIDSPVKIRPESR